MCGLDTATMNRTQRTYLRALYVLRTWSWTSYRPTGSVLDVKLKPEFVNRLFPMSVTTSGRARP
jgi:hypothetical protein